MWRNVTNDVKLAGRSLLKSPRFTAIAGITLALGIGANTAIFSVVDGVLLEPLDFPESERLATVWSNADGLGYDQFPLSPDVYAFYRAESTAFEELATFQLGESSLTSGGEPERVRSIQTTHTLFDVLGVPPLLGRTFTEEEDRPEANPVAVISHELWQRRYGADPGVLGRTEAVSGVVHEIVGVMPERFTFPDDAALWIPSGFDPDNPPIGNFGWNAVGRLAPGVEADEAQAQLVPLVRRIMEANSDAENYYNFLENGRYAPLVHSLKEDTVGSLREPLWILLGTVGFVLLIACANVANLVLIRAESRQREIAVRSAMGASRGLLVRQSLAESLVLSTVGGIAGVLLAWLGTPLLLRAAPPQIPRVSEVGVDGTVMLFAVAAVAFSALLFGAIPAFRYTRPSVVAALRQGGRGSTAGRGRRLGRDLLVVAQTALALVLLVGSGLLVKSFWQLWRTDPGFRHEDVLTFGIALPASSYPDPTDVSLFFGELGDRLRAIPGVTAAGAASVLPLQGGAPGTAMAVDGQPVEAGQLPPMLHYKTVTPGYFDAMGIPRMTGSVVERGSEEVEATSVVVSRRLAEEHWPGESALGQRIRFAGDTVNWFTVVGTVGSVRQEGLREDPAALVYFTYSETSAPRVGGRTMSWAVRGRDVAMLAPRVRTMVAELDPELPVADLRTMESIVSDSIVQLSFTMMTLGVAALMALLLGAVGLYGVLSYAVSQRTREIGVRMALGAERSAVMGMVVAQGARLAVLGLVVGVGGAVLLSRLLRELLYGTPPLDPLTYGGTAVLLLSVGLLASYLPARRAAAVDPTESIRME